MSSSGNPINPCYCSKNEFLPEDIKESQRTEVNENETIVLIIIGLLVILLPFIGWIHDKRKGIRYNRARGGRQLYLEMRKARRQREQAKEL